MAALLGFPSSACPDFPFWFLQWVTTEWGSLSARSGTSQPPELWFKMNFARNDSWLQTELQYRKIQVVRETIHGVFIITEKQFPTALLLIILCVYHGFIAGISAIIIYWICRGFYVLMMNFIKCFSGICCP